MNFDYGYLYQQAPKSDVLEPRIVSMWDFTQTLDGMVRENNQITAKVKQRFLQANQAFAQEVAPYRITQFCYSRLNRKLYTMDYYTRNIPSQESGCRHSMAVTPLRLLQPKANYERSM